MTEWTMVFSRLHLAAAAGLAIFGLFGWWTLWLLYRCRRSAALPAAEQDEWPVVTVQLPVFNEADVIGELIDSVAVLDYPRRRLQIQVLDDSTDSTTELAAARVKFYQRSGIDIELIHRDHRCGFKAGALGEGLSAARGEFVAVFDADFRPRPDFLKRTVPHFNSQPRLALVQARWEHLNRGRSWLTSAQAIALDRHFAVDQEVRFQHRLFPKFNGAAGVWRRQALEDAGGWLTETLCEDLCLSLRAVLRGWKFLFLSEVTAPAELPFRLSAYRVQQTRWAKGSTQCLLRYAVAVWRAPRTLRARLFALITMSGYLTTWMFLTALFCMVPLAWLDFRFPSAMLLLGLAGAGQPLLFLQSQRRVGGPWKRRIWHVGWLLLLVMGNSAAVARSAAEAFLGIPSNFERTPKGRRLPSGASNSLPWQEIGLAMFAGLGVAGCLWRSNYGTLPFFLGCVLAFSLVARELLAERFGADNRDEQPATTSPPSVVATP